MIYAWLFKAFDFIAHNKTAQMILAAIAIVLVWLGYGKLKEEQGKKKQKAADVKATVTTLNKIEEKSDAIIAQADRIRAANPVVGDGERLSDPAEVAGYEWRN